MGSFVGGTSGGQEQASHVLGLESGGECGFCFREACVLRAEGACMGVRGPWSDVVGEGGGVLAVTSPVVLSISIILLMII